MRLDGGMAMTLKEFLLAEIAKDEERERRFLHYLDLLDTAPAVVSGSVLHEERADA